MLRARNKVMGFPYPAKDYQEDAIDLAKVLVQHPASTFYFKIKGDSMCNANIPDGALLIVDRSVQVASGMIIVAVVNGEFTVRRIIQTNRSWVLHPENPVYKPVTVTEEMNMQVWGVVTSVVIRHIK
jgi:DNA polymerase V